MDIIDTVARAILEHEWGQPVENVYEEDRQLARAAIMATLEAMIDVLTKEINNGR